VAARELEAYGCAVLLCEGCGRAWAESRVAPEALAAGACPGCGGGLVATSGGRFARPPRARTAPSPTASAVADALRAAGHPRPVSVGAKPWRVDPAEGEVARILRERLTGLGA
jgi:hypothetical protein